MIEVSPLRVAAGIIWRGDRFLAASRPEGKSWAGYWEFPGGKLEEGETPVQALSRELFEELGITTSHVLPWRVHTHTYPEVTVSIHFIHVLTFHGEPEPKDGQQLLWVTKNEAKNLRFLPGDEGLLQDITLPV